MKVDPYVRAPKPPTLLALLRPDGTIVDEHGDTINPDNDWPEGCRCFTSYDTVRELVTQGNGEGLCWNREEIRWRHRRFEDGWKRRQSDVAVIKLPFPESDQRTLLGLRAWRNWLASHGASLGGGTSGAAAWSLLRASLEEPLWLAVGARPPLRQTLGGRQELGPHGQGRFEGVLSHYDLPAAYASQLGGLRYGGRWIRDSGAPSWWARDGKAVFVRAKVTVPAGILGPLPRRPRKPAYGLRSVLLGSYYPSGCRMQGIWSFQELEAARDAGVKVHRILDTWVHVAGDAYPFASWWSRVQEGRRMPGLAGMLAKTTGNALWGQFCMDAHSNGERSVSSSDSRGRMSARVLPFAGGRPPDHALAETVSGRVRALLYRAMVAAGDGLASAHTDGIWIVGGSTNRSKSPGCEPGRCQFESDPSLSNWRLKEQARRLDLLDPQVLRYWPKPMDEREPFHVFSGMPSSQQPEMFEQQWQAHLQERSAA